MVTFPSLRRQVDMNMCVVRLSIGKGDKENCFKENKNCFHCECDDASPTCISIWSVLNSSKAVKEDNYN